MIPDQRSGAPAHHARQIHLKCADGTQAAISNVAPAWRSAGIFTSDSMLFKQKPSQAFKVGRNAEYGCRSSMPQPVHNGCWFRLPDQQAAARRLESLW